MHIILVARHYPPEISGGARRPYLYTQALRRLGHKVTLITPFEIDDENHICIKNKAINNAQSASVNNSKRNIIVSAKNFLRQWVFWPDADIRWAKSVVKYLEEKPINADWIITTSPPESIHYVGAYITRKTAIPWAAEMRDTWVELPHRIVLKNHLRAIIEKRIAKAFLRNARAIICVSERLAEEVKKYAKPRTNIEIIGHFSDPPPKPYDFDNNKINVLHSGGFSLSDRRRKLSELVTSLERLIHKDKKFALHITGKLTNEEIKYTHNSKLDIVLHGMVSLDKSKAMQAGADGLILATPENSHALPGKYAEYAQANRPIFYTGGGWLDLLEDKNSVRPLNEIAKLTKNQPGPNIKTLNHVEAARKLVDFLTKPKQA